MLLSAILPLLLMQVGPNPTQPELSELPIDPEGRRGERTVAQQPAAPQIPERLRECLLEVRGDPQRGEAYARNWLGEASGTDAALAGQCLGMAYYTQQRFDEAMTSFLAARDRLPQGAAAERGRLAALAGNAGLAAGSFDSALAALDEARIDAVAAQNDQLLGETNIDRARALVSLSREEEAADALADAREALPDNATAWLLSATLSRRLERFANAQAQIERAAELAPRNPEIGLEAGRIAAVSGRYEDARRSFESVIAVAPDTPYARRADESLERLEALTRPGGDAVPSAPQPRIDPETPSEEGR
ncbi:tetratricopeptide repeat protein [Altererythrobacter aurantiacus]|uniref:Tetratricopeptide repeat protein n=1 Tax=Parapontixanthobacter aurantiacus TaxID=1463599 RepID=A0A844ZFQ3_9SPHN|nr:tetratricopeptide repeat protein [Parapontixanthobacter aurantiacus]MXO86082.1 tetratricopeptide repeat protein [Parapontixanthobacter aurantiacus]